MTRRDHYPRDRRLGDLERVGLDRGGLRTRREERRRVGAGR